MAGSGKKAEEVYRWLMAYIDENKFSGNLRLPSENALCRRLDVSRETVRCALDRIAREGLVCRVKGSGTYINKETALSRELGRMKREGLIDFRKREFRIYPERGEAARFQDPQD